MELSKGIDTKAKYDGHRACEKCQVNSNTISGDYSAKKDRQLSLNTY